MSRAVDAAGQGIVSCQRKIDDEDEKGPMDGGLDDSGDGAKNYPDDSLR